VGRKRALGNPSASGGRPGFGVRQPGSPPGAGELWTQPSRHTDAGRLGVSNGAAAPPAREWDLRPRSLTILKHAKDAG